MQEQACHGEEKSGRRTAGGGQQSFRCLLPAARRSLFFSGRSTLAVLIFLLLFSTLIVIVMEFFLLPAMSVVKDATPAERLRLQAVSTLLLAIVLLILIVGLMLTFRIGRFFFPRPTEPRIQTKYVDAWTEAGRRAATPDEPKE